MKYVLFSGSSHLSYSLNYSIRILVQNKPIIQHFIKDYHNKIKVLKNWSNIHLVTKINDNNNDNDNNKKIQGYRRDALRTSSKELKNEWAKSSFSWIEVITQMQKSAKGFWMTRWFSKIMRSAFMLNCKIFFTICPGSFQEFRRKFFLKG